MEEIAYVMMAIMEILPLKIVKVVSQDALNVIIQNVRNALM